MREQTFVPARVDEIRRDSGDWVFVDIGFAQRGNRSCGVAFNDGDPFEVEFGILAPTIMHSISKGSGAVQLLIEAPLSVAFDVEGHPTGRRIERRGGSTRYWYESSGCRTLVAATYLLRELKCRCELRPFKRQIRLVEGFGSFKDGSSPHPDDVARLRSIAWQRGGPHDRIVPPSELRAHPCDHVVSAFAVSGMECGVPPVVEVVDEVPEP